MKKQAIVAFSMGYRETKGQKKPGTTNVGLSWVVDVLFKRLREEKPNNDLQIYPILQWEIADCVRCKPALAIHKHRIDGKYLDSDEVAEQAIEFMNKEGIDEVWIVAYRFLHLHKCIGLLKRRGKKVLIPEELKKIPVRLDPLSAQPWTRTNWKLLKYAIQQKFFGQKGP